MQILERGADVGAGPGVGIECVIKFNCVESENSVQFQAWRVYERGFQLFFVQFVCFIAGGGGEGEVVPW